MAQEAEHILGKDEVTRSNRVISSKENLVKRLEWLIYRVFAIYGTDGDCD